MHNIEPSGNQGLSGINRGKTVLATLLVVIPVLAAMLYGVIGKDKTLLLSPLLGIGYVCLALWMVYGAVSRRFRASAPPGFYPLIIFVLYGSVIAFGCEIPYEAKIRMLVVGLVVGAFYVWANSFDRFPLSRTVLGWVIFLAVLASFYGLVIHFKCPEKVLWTERYTDGYISNGRLCSTYICPNHFAHVLQMLLPFCLVLVFISEAGLYLRILAGYGLLVFIPPLFLTQSRAGWLGSIAAVGTTLLLIAFRRNKKVFALLLLFVPLCSGLLLVGAWRFSETFQQRMAPVVEFLGDVRSEGFANTQTTDFRPLTWLDSIEMVRAKPIWGFGPGSYRYAFPEFRERFQGKRIVTGHPHNEYLELASEFGLVGFSIFALAWCYALIRLLIFSMKTDRQHHALLAMAFIGTAAGTMVHSFFDFQMHIFPNVMLFTLLAAIAFGPLNAQLRDRRYKIAMESSRMRRAGVPHIVLAVISLAVLLIALPVFLSSSVRAWADRLASQKNVEKAIRYYTAAIRYDSANWEAYGGLASLYTDERYYCLDMDEKLKLAALEKDNFERALLHNPKHAKGVLDYGRVLAFLGDRDEAIAIMKQAVVLRPFNDAYWWNLGVQQRKGGYYADALDTFTYAATVKNSPSIRKNIQWLKSRINRQDNPERVDQSETRPSMNLRLKQDEGGLSDLLNQMDKSD